MKAVVCLALIMALCSAEDALKTDDDIMLAFTKMQAQQNFETKHALLMGKEAPAPAEFLLEEVPKAESNFAKVPSWVSTEDDLEEFLQAEKKKGAKIVRKQNGKVKKKKQTLTQTKMKRRCNYHCSKQRGRAHGHCKISHHRCRCHNWCNRNRRGRARHHCHHGCWRRAQYRHQRHNRAHRAHHHCHRHCKRNKRCYHGCRRHWHKWVATGRRAAAPTLTEESSVMRKHKRWRGRRTRKSVVRRWKKVRKTIKPCEVKVTGAKWNKIKGQCRGALRFCVLYRKFAKRFRMPSLLRVARPHCKKARKFHRKLWLAAVVAARKARHARLRACLKNKRCRRAYYRRLRRQARRKRYAAHRRCMKKKKCRTAWIRRRRWAAKRRLARHKKCMKSKKCKARFFARLKKARAARLARYRRRVARHKACMKKPKCKKRFLARRNARRASRRRAHIRCMKNKGCKARYLAWRKRRAARRAAWKKRRAARRKARKGKKGKKKSKKGKKKKKKSKKGKKKGIKKGIFSNRHLKKMRKHLHNKKLKAPKKVKAQKGKKGKKKKSKKKSKKGKTMKKKKAKKGKTGKKKARKGKKGKKKKQTLTQTNMKCNHRCARVKNRHHRVHCSFAQSRCNCHHWCARNRRGHGRGICHYQCNRKANVNHHCHNYARGNAGKWHRCRRHHNKRYHRHVNHRARRAHHFCKHRCKRNKKCYHGCRRHNHKWVVTGRRAAASELELVQYTKFPSWVETEDDMEAYFKQKHITVTRKDSGNGGVNPSGRKFVVDVQPKKTVEEEAPVVLLEESTEKPTPAVKDRMQRLAKLNKRMATAGANKLISELNSF